MRFGRTILKGITAFLITAILLFPTTTFSQTRKRTTKSSARATKPQPQPDLAREGAARVADRIKNLTHFLYVLGGVAKGIESVDDATRRNEASPAVVAQTQKDKATIKTSIQTVREGLDQLEIDFRTTPGLQPYYIKLAGVAAGAVSAEQQAAANQVDRAGRTLLKVVDQLTDVLLEMRK
jgi:hypothetical protein